MVSFARRIDQFEALEESAWQGMPDSLAAFFVDNSTDVGAFYRIGRIGNVSGVAGVGAEAAAASREDEDKNYRKRGDFLFNSFANNSAQTTMSQLIDRFFSFTFQTALHNKAAEVATRAGVDLGDANVRAHIQDAVHNDLGGAQGAILAAAPESTTDVSAAGARLAETNRAGIENMRDRICDDIGGEQAEVCRAVPLEDWGSMALFGITADASPAPAPSTPKPRSELVLGR